MLAGGEIAAARGGGALTLSLDAGDVAEILTPPGEEYDLFGSLVQANKPVQVITGIGCISIPHDKHACDHVEESVLGPLASATRSRHRRAPRAVVASIWCASMAIERERP